VLRKPNKQIEIYDITTSILQRTLDIESLSDDRWGFNGMAACVTTKCLFFNDWDKYRIYKVGLGDDNEIQQWQVTCGPRGLSVNSAGNLLVSCFATWQLVEYNTRNWSVVSVVNLRHDDVTWTPVHAIQLSDSQYVVCGRAWRSGEDATYFDVVEVTVERETKQVESTFSYRSQLNSLNERRYFNDPRHLAYDVDNIYVADFGNNRIVMLNRSGRYAREWTETVDGGRLVEPRCLYLSTRQTNEQPSRLYVGYNGSRVSVFDVSGN
jgi:hypothetical protein